MESKNKDVEHLMRAIVIAYQNPVRLNPISKQSPNYSEGKIIYSDKIKAIGFADGWKVQYSVYGYKFRRINNSKADIDKFISMILSNPKRYVDPHHINFYGGVSKKWIRTIQLSDYSPAKI